VVVSNICSGVEGKKYIFYVHPEPWGKPIQFDKKLFKWVGWNHQLVYNGIPCVCIICVYRLQDRYIRTGHPQRKLPPEVKGVYRNILVVQNTEPQKVRSKMSGGHPIFGGQDMEPSNYRREWISGHQDIRISRYDLKIPKCFFGKDVRVGWFQLVF